MLNEIIRVIGKEKIENMQTDCISTGNCIYVKIYNCKENKYDIEYIDTHEPNIKQLEFLDWCKEREIYSNYLDSNRAIVQSGDYSKVILSCIPYSIIFKWSSFIKCTKRKKINQNLLRNCLYKMIQEYLNELNFGDYINNYVVVLEDIILLAEQIVEQGKKIIDNLKIKIFLDENIQNYKKEYEKYCDNKIFVSNAKQLNLDNDIKSRGSFFLNLNSKKPLLSYMNNKFETHVLNKADAKFQIKLNIYLNWKKEEAIDDGLQLIHYITENKNGKNIIQDFDISLVKTREPLIYCNIYNVMSLPKFKEYTINSYLKLTNYIKKITSKEYITGEKSGSFLEENMYNSLFIRYGRIIKNINEKNIEQFKRIYKNFIKDLFKLYFKNNTKYSILNITKLLNFHISLNDWLFNKNIKEDFMIFINQIKKKILDKQYEITSNEEFFFMCGQMVKYLKMKTDIEEKTNKLFREYILAKDTKRIVNLLEKDKEHLDYKGFANHNRSNSIFASIELYFISHNEELLELRDGYNRNIFIAGIYYWDNLIYIKEKENKNEE